MKKLAVLAAACVLLLSACSSPSVTPLPASAATATPAPTPKREWHVGLARSRLDWANGRVSLLSHEGVSLFEIPVRVAGLMSGASLPPPVDGARVAFSSFESSLLTILDTHTGATGEVDVGAWPEVLAGGGGAFFCAYVKAGVSTLARVVKPKEKFVSAKLSDPVGAMAVSGDELIAATRAPDGFGNVMVLNASDLTEKKRIPLPEGNPWSLAVMGNTAYIAYLPGVHGQDGMRLCAVDLDKGTTRLIQLGGMAEPALQILQAGGLIVVSRYDPTSHEGTTLSFFDPADEKVRHMDLDHRAVQMAAVDHMLYITDKSDVYAYSLPGFSLAGSFHVLDDEDQFSGLFASP